MKTLLKIIIGSVIFSMLCRYSDPQPDMNIDIYDNSINGTTKPINEHIDTLIFPHWRAADSIVGVDAQYTDIWCSIASGIEY